MTDHLRPCAYRRAALAVLAPVLLLMASLAGCSDPADAQGGPPPAAPVSVAPAVQRTVSDSEEFSGRLEASEFVELRPRVAGTIDQVHFTDGALVKKGQLLFSIDSRGFAADVARAESQLAAVSRARRAGADRAEARAGAGRRQGRVAAGVRPAELGRAHHAGRHQGGRGGAAHGAPEPRLRRGALRRSPAAHRAPTSPPATWSTTRRC